MKTDEEERVRRVHGELRDDFDEQPELEPEDRSIHAIAAGHGQP